jgi:hypothetical protein
MTSSSVRSAAGLVLIFSLGCVQPSTQASRDEDRANIQKELSGEMSLKADREALAEMRKGIPAEKQKSNDELALNLQLMKQGTEQPAMVRDKFTVLVEKKRTSFRDKVQKLRNSYSKSETKRRDEFLDGQKAKRTDYLKTKRKPDEMREYFGDQDRARQAFFSDERDRRASFESDISSQSKDFDSYMREKLNEFNEQYRLYSKQFSEKPKDKKAVTGEAPPDFHKMDQVPTKPLGTEP